MIKDWHIINIFEYRVECSCGFVRNFTKQGRAMRSANRHGRNNRPSIGISRHGCTDLCIRERMIRDLKVTFHDIDCPNHMDKKKEAHDTKPE